MFPFNYQGKQYSECTTVNYGDKLWCAAVPDYDVDPLWGDCICSYVQDNQTPKPPAGAPSKELLINCLKTMYIYTYYCIQISLITLKIYGRWCCNCIVHLNNPGLSPKLSLKHMIIHVLY